MRWTLLLVAACTPRGSSDEVASDPVDADPADETGAVGSPDREPAFAGGFSPSGARWGGFGGGDCTPRRVPVVLIHGNGDDAFGFLAPASDGGTSPVQALRDAGYRRCELFAVTWLSPAERAAPERNYHRPEKAALLRAFVDDVVAWTGAPRVDVVAHSLGVTAALHALEGGGLDRVRRFVAVAGALRGLTSCRAVGPANPFVPTCGSQNLLDDDVFGFHPDDPLASNPRMGAGGFRDVPATAPGTTFYGLRAGRYDQVLCAAPGFVPGCADAARFDPADNVAAQLDLGHGATAASADWDWSDWTPLALSGGDTDGVGHFRVRSDAGRVLVGMLRDGCVGAACCDGHPGPCAE